MTGIAIEIEAGIEETSKDLTEIKKEIARETEKEVTNNVRGKINLQRKRILTMREGVRLNALEEMTLQRHRKCRVNWRSRSFLIKKKGSLRKLNKNSVKHVYISKLRKVNVGGQKRRSHHPSLLSSFKGKRKRHLEFFQQG